MEFNSWIIQGPFIFTHITEGSIESFKLIESDLEELKLLLVNEL